MRAEIHPQPFLIRPARARAAPSPHAPEPARRTPCFQEDTAPAPLSLEELEAQLFARVAACQDAVPWRFSELVRQAQRRALAVAGWPVGRACPVGRVREAWVVFRYGSDQVGERGAADAGPLSPGLAARAARAIGLYEAHPAARPPGWPASGPAALTALAAQRRAATLAGDVQRLLNLAKDMRAVQCHNDPERLARAQRRAHQRHQAATPPDGPSVAFRRPPGRPRFETPELRRRRIRDELLRAGEHPGLGPHVFCAAWQAAQRHQAAGTSGWGDPDLYRLPDGLTHRAQRYHHDLHHGRWTLPAGWPGALGAI